MEKDNTKICTKCNIEKSLDNFHKSSHKKDGKDCACITCVNRQKNRNENKKICLTKEKCREEALKYKTKIEFRKNSPSAYNTAKHMKWFGEICEHMIYAKIIWTKEKCREEALKYETRIEFQKNSPSAYSRTSANGWLDDVCTHLLTNYDYWTKENCALEALKYNTKVEFKMKSQTAYVKSCANKWIDEICQHMIINGNLKNRCIYAAEFEDNSVYIGLTYSINRRKYSHLNDENSSIFKHIKETKTFPKFKQLTDYIEINNAVSKEKFYVNYYRNKNWNILNKTKTGTIGGNTLKWTKDECIKEALKYNKRTKFFKNASGSYNSAGKNGWLNEICQHMV